MKTILKNIAPLVIALAHLSCYGNNYSIEFLTTEEGLSLNEVQFITQDSKGFMWQATRAAEKPELIKEFESKMMNKLLKINDPWTVED